MIVYQNVRKMKFFTFFMINERRYVKKIVYRINEQIIALD